MTGQSIAAQRDFASNLGERRGVGAAGSGDASDRVSVLCNLRRMNCGEPAIRFYARRSRAF